MRVRYRNPEFLGLSRHCLVVQRGSLRLQDVLSDLARQSSTNVLEHSSERLQRTLQLCETQA